QRQTLGKMTVERSVEITGQLRRLDRDEADLIVKRLKRRRVRLLGDPLAHQGDIGLELRNVLFEERFGFEPCMPFLVFEPCAVRAQTALVFDRLGAAGVNRALATLDRTAP